MRRIGDFRIEKKLGAGGMGIVYLATREPRDPDEIVGPPVALKVMHIHLIDNPGYLRRFKREAEMGRRLSHRNVVRTLEHGDLELDGRQVPYLVMEYLRGRSLYDLLGAYGTVPETFLRTIARDIADGLCAIHSLGIVHRDLKPANILVTDDHRVQIMDLGVARADNESRALTETGEFAGSLAFAAPELLKGHPVTFASDLYSLGILLYELASGINPFRNEQPAAVVTAQLQFVPPPLETRVPGISRFFSDVVDALLEKKPTDRLSSASQLLRILEEGENSVWWAVRESRLSDSGQLPAVTVRRDTKIYGRKSALDTLTRTWEEVREGSGRVVLIEGLAGLGKTRLVDSFMDRLPSCERNVLYGSYPPFGGMGALTDALYSRFGRGRLKEALEPFFRGMPALLAPFVAVVSEEDPARGGGALPEEALHAGFAQLLKALSSERPLIWIVEDLHFAGADSRNLVLSMARHAERVPVMLVVTARQDAESGPPVEFPGVSRITRIGLDPLRQPEVAAMIRDLLESEALASELAPLVTRKSDGIPFYVLECVRSMREHGQVVPMPSGEFSVVGDISGISVPTSLKELVRARIAELTSDERGLLEVGAVQGFTFDPELVAQVRNQTPVEVLEALVRLERRVGVVRAEGSRYRFEHHQDQETIYEDLPEPLRREYHRLLAVALAARDGADLGPGAEIQGENAFILAQHHLCGSRPRDGAPFFLPAMDFLRRTSRHESLLDLADRVLSIGALGDDGIRLGVLLRKAEILDFLVRPAAAEAALEEARSLPETCGQPRERCRLLRLEGRIEYSEHGGTNSALDLLERAESIARENGLTDEEGAALTAQGDILGFRGRPEEARRCYERALAIAVKLGDLAAQSAALLRLGRIQVDYDDPTGGRGKIQEALRLSARAEDRRLQCEGIAGLAHASFATLSYEEARSYFEMGLRLSRELANRRGESDALEGLTRLAFHLGDTVAAERHTSELLDLARRMDSPRMEGRAGFLQGRILAHQGKVGDALEQFRQAAKRLEQAGDRRQAGNALAERGRLLALVGDGVGAVAAQSKALSLVRSTGDKLVEAWVFLGLACASERAGEWAEARGFLLAARSLFEAFRSRRGTAASALAMGRILLEEGTFDLARTELVFASTTAREMDEPKLYVPALCHRARQTPSALHEALEAFEAEQVRLGLEMEIECRGALWKATGEAKHLNAAHHLVQQLAVHVPNVPKKQIVRAVPLHREIHSAFLASV